VATQKFEMTRSAVLKYQHRYCCGVSVNALVCLLMLWCVC